MEEEYRITPKGRLCVRLNCDQKLTDFVWNALREIGREHLEQNGAKGIPALVFDGGGAWLGVSKQCGTSTSKT